MLYLENEANFSKEKQTNKKTGHCLTGLNKTACKICSVLDKVHF